MDLARHGAYAAGAALTPKAPVALPTPISLLAGERRAFYLRETDGRNLAYTDGDGVGTLEAADGNLRIFEGTGIGGTFGAPLADRIPNIAIHYTPADPFLLTTGFLGGNNGKGIMFDVVAKSSLSLVSLQLAPSAGFPGLRTFDVYTRSGTHVGAEGNAAAWTLIRRVSFHSDGNRTPFEVELPRPIAMAKGSTRGFYIIALSGGVLSYSNGGPEGVGNVEASDAHLTILKGRHHTDLFTPTEFERVPNVAFRYRNRDRAAPRLTIVGPRRIRATKPRATIYGIATDDVRVAHVRATYRRATPRGLGKKTNKRVVPRASGLFKLNLKLAPGRNPVVFRAFDGDGRSSAPARVTVIR